MLQLSDKTVRKHLEAERPLFVMFHAAFSGPCKLAMPEFVKASETSKDGPRFATFDLDGNTVFPAQFNVRGIPEFILFVGGKPSNPTVGALTCEQILTLSKGESL